MIKILDDYILSKMTYEGETIIIPVSSSMLKFITTVAKGDLVVNSVGEINTARYSNLGVTLHFYSNAEYEEQSTDSEFEYFVLNQMAKNYTK